MDDLVVIKELKTHFYTSGRVIHAVDGIDLKIAKGETVGLVGETGCGKTVTALSIMRLIYFPPGKIVSGNIFFEGRDLLKLSEKEIRENIRGAKISMIFQEPRTSMNPVFRISQQMIEVIKLHQKLTSNKAKIKAIEMLEQTKMPEPQRIMNCYPHELSGGMLQRAMIAMELSCNPLLFIADEPTTALDVTIQAQILQLMKKIQRKMGMAVLLISHDLGVIAQLCQKVGVMYAGHIVEYAPVENIFENPVHPYTRALLSSVVGLEQTGKRLETISGEVPDLRNPPAGCCFHPRCDEATDQCQRKAIKSIEIESNHFVYCHSIA
jgi:peptide/nickel transport system ATP-binding protein/oligopeptide transport system ATP-binding protein